MSDRIAVVDVGTNTFHLLIVELDASGFREILRKRVFVKLAEEGIERLGSNAIHRGLQSLMRFRELVDNHQVSAWRVIGTAALRTATNGLEFISTVEATTGFEIELIDGLKEAELIYEGVRQVWSCNPQPSLIMDIGGGSVEFIIADEEGIIWLDSFPIGIALLYRRFHQSDPVAEEEKMELHAFLQDHLQTLRQQLITYYPSRLIGASGTFDVLSASLGGAGEAYHECFPDAILPKLIAIEHLSHAQRLQDPSIPIDRVDMIVVAVLLIKFVLHMHSFDKIGFSSYAVKEGLLTDLRKV